MAPRKKTKQPAVADIQEEEQEQEDRLAAAVLR